MDDKLNYNSPEFRIEEKENGEFQVCQLDHTSRYHYYYRGIGRHASLDIAREQVRIILESREQERKKHTTIRTYTV